MKILFLSNYYTHHQRPLCEALDDLTEHSFTFMETAPFPEERRHLGWEAAKDVPFVRQYEPPMHEDILDADLVILGSAPHAMVRERLKAGKPVFLYAERIFKNGYEPFKWLPRLFRFWMSYSRHRSLYLLSASAYTASDYGLHGAFLGKSYRWGYFPEAKEYDLAALMDQKDPTKLLWCGRFLDWKHPETALEIAARLKADGYVFSLDLIGTGPLESALRQQIRDRGLSDCVRILGPVPAAQVRKHMERAGIYLFTSDFHEGWGAVLNEAMNSGCAVTASHAIGSVPFLLRQGENGIVYRNGDTNRLYAHIRFLLEHPQQQTQLGRNAYETIHQLWNADTAARRLLQLADALRKNESCPQFETGPCSRAPLIWNNWLKG